MVDLVPYIEIKRLVELSYDILNGKINNIVHSNKIIYMDNHTTIVGSNFGNFIFIDINSIKLYLESIFGNVSSNDAYQNAKGCILAIVAHELSHTDQYLSQIEYTNNTEYSNFIERANNANSLVYLIENESYIKKLYGEFKLYCEIAYQHVNLTTKIFSDSKFYKKVPNIEYRIKDIIKFIGNANNLIKQNDEIHIIDIHKCQHIFSTYKNGNNSIYTEQFKLLSLLSEVSLTFDIKVNTIYLYGKRQLIININPNNKKIDTVLISKK